MFDCYNNLIAFNADSTRFLTSSRFYHLYEDVAGDYTISIFDVQTGKLVREIKPTGGELDEIEATPEKNIVLAADSTGFHFWNIETGQLLSTIPQGTHVFDPKSGQIWVAVKIEAELYQIVLFDYLTGNKIRELEPIQANVITRLHLTETQKLMVLLHLPVAQEGRPKVSMIDLQTNTVSDLSKAAPAYQSVSFAQNIFATYNWIDNGYISLWNFEQNTPYLVLLGSHQNTTINDAKDTSKTFNARVQFFNENVLVTQGDTIRFWDTKKGILLSELKPDYSIADIAFNPNQQLIAVRGMDGIIRLWGVPKP